jgi:signal recognition particle subunit SRP54
LDGDTRGGAALSIKFTVGKPIKFVSEGEKLETLDIFYPDRMATRILGMGDIVSLVEKAQAQIDEKEAARLQKRISKNQFDFDDFLTQLGHIKKMGNIKNLISMIPGMGKMAKNLDIDDKAFVRIEAMIQSMTPHERANPDKLNMSRKKRIAKGSGHELAEINQFVRQFEEMRKMMHKMSKMQGGGAGAGGGRRSKTKTRTRKGRR